MKSTLRLSIVFTLLNVVCWAQSPNATLAGRVLDPSSALVSDAKVVIINLYTNIHYTGQTNREGSFVIPNLPPGPYRIEVSKSGFKTAIREDVVLRVQDVIALNFTLPVGSVTESITVSGGGPLVNTQDAAVSTVVDRNFAEKLPLNGRSFQSLIELTPGVVLTTSNISDSGQFSVNGQRAVSNYWMVDGVSANIGMGVNVGALPGNGLGGALGSFSAQGGTNSLVSVDAMQEFRIQTSTYAPEFGRTPGGQISIVTRSGTDQFHGTLFDYFRNDVLDANNWFNGYTNIPPLPKAKERQNDFGGTVGGPIVKDRTFFFFSYEGLRLRLPETTLSTVPDLSARQNAVAAMQPFLNAFPFDPNQPDLGSGIAQFNASYSNPSTLDAYSLRIDHRLRNKFTLFGRYDYSPSQIVQRGQNASSLSDVFRIRITTQTATVGATWIVSSAVTNDLRFNYSRTNADGSARVDNFGGAVPLSSLPLPSPFTAENAVLNLFVSSLAIGGELQVGRVVRNLQRQINVVDGLSVQRNSHSLKFGFDFRRLSPQFDPSVYTQDAIFSDVPSMENGNLSQSLAGSSINPTFLFRDLGLHAQDTWRIVPRLTATYGLRWDVNFVPEALPGPGFPAVAGFNLNNLSTLALAPAGTPPYNTNYGSLAPRIGIAYQLFQSHDWQTVLRGGFGIFYDLATSEAGNSIGAGSYPFGADSICPNPSNPACPTGNLTFPLSPTTAAPPTITAPNAINQSGLFAFDPKLKAPYTLQWNVAFEQALGNQQTISASYIGATGRRLLQTAFVFSPNPSFGFVQLVINSSTSDYNALQVQFQRRLSHGLQALASYTWSHSIDTASAGSAFGNSANVFVPSQIAASNRGPSDFDVRNAFSAGVTYDIQVPRVNAFANALLRGWSTETFIVARSAPPVYVQDSGFTLFNNRFASIRPDLVPGQPLFLYGSQCVQALPMGLGQPCPGGKGINPQAFQDPPIDSVTFSPLRQGNVPRNFLRGFGATQWDLAAHRDFPIHESVKLQFRAELFNVLNHPNFGPLNGSFLPGGYPGFGVSSQMLGQSLSSFNQGGGGFSALYQIGGPRSIQLALKLSF
jgi:hypothetical protein